jgi:hypothetical protein
MRLSTLWQYRRPLLRWGLFLLALGSVGATLYAVQPPEPRWQREDRPLAAFNTGLGRIATYRSGPNGNAGPVQLLDAASGEELGSFLSDAPVFKSYAQSVDGRYLVAVVKSPQPNTWQIRGADLHELREWQADIPLERFQSATFSPRCDYVALDQPQPKGVSYALVETSSGRIAERVQVAAAVDRTEFSRDGSWFFVTYHDEDGTHHIRAISTHTGRTSTLDNATLLAVAPDGRRVIADCGEDGIWMGDVADGTWRCCLEQAESPRPQKAQALYVQALHSYHVTNLRLNLNQQAKAVRLWNAKLRLKNTSLWVDWLANDIGIEGPTFSPDGRYVLWRGRQSGERAFALHEIDTGRRLWQRSWPTDLHGPLFTPDSRQLVLAGGGRMEVVDAATGVTERTAESPELHGDDLLLSAHGRTLVLSGTVAEEEPSWLWAHVLEWLPEQPDVAMRKACLIHLETGTAVREVTWEQLNDWWLTDDGRSLIAVAQLNDESGVTATVIYGWDVPRNKPLRWALGVPLGLGVTLVSVRQAWRRWRKARGTPTKGT